MAQSGQPKGRRGRPRLTPACNTTSAVKGGREGRGKRGRISQNELDTAVNAIEPQIVPEVPAKRKRAPRFSPKIDMSAIHPSNLKFLEGDQEFMATTMPDAAVTAEPTVKRNFAFLTTTSLKLYSLGDEIELSQGSSSPDREIEETTFAHNLNFRRTIPGGGGTDPCSRIMNISALDLLAEGPTPTVEDIEKECFNKLIAEHELDIDSEQGSSPLVGPLPISKSGTHLERSMFDEIIHITLDNRAELVDWVIRVHQHRDFGVETLFRAIELLDTYLAFNKSLTKYQFYLVGLTALFMAAQQEEGANVQLEEFLEAISDGRVLPTAIRNVEERILISLKHKTRKSNAYHLLSRLIQGAKEDDASFLMCQYFLESSLTHAVYFSTKPAQLAAAVFFLALHLSLDDPKYGTGLRYEHWTQKHRRAFHYEAHELVDITREIAKIVYEARKAPYRSAYTKYAQNCLLKTSNRPELYKQLMRSIIKGHVQV